MFFPFLQSTARSEGFNAVLKRYINPSNSMLEFVKQYAAIQNKILGVELEAEANTVLKVPKTTTYKPMEKQMMKKYTRRIFYKQVYHQHLPCSQYGKMPCSIT